MRCVSTVRHLPLPKRLHLRGNQGRTWPRRDWAGADASSKTVLAFAKETGAVVARQFPVVRSRSWQIDDERVIDRCIRCGYAKPGALPPCSAF